MEDELAGFEFHHLDSVQYEFRNTLTDPKVLKKYLAFLENSRSVYELHEKIIQAMHKLEALQSFKSCDVKVYPGKLPDTALVSFMLQDNNWWSISTGVTANNEGGKTEFIGNLKNLRSKADQTTVKIDYKPTTKTYGYQFLHHDKLFIPGKWEAIYSFNQGIQELDTNLKETNYYGSFALKTFSGNNRFEIGRGVRTNTVRVENSSVDLVCDALPVNAKNYVSHTFAYDSRDDSQFPRSGNCMTLTNEFAYGSDNKFHKFDVKMHSFFKLSSDFVFQSTFIGGMLMPWFSSKVSVNDRYRLRYVKGFNSVGSKKLAANPSVVIRDQVNGDDLGKFSSAVLEAKVHYYGFSTLQGMGLAPFVYGNFVLEDPLKLSSFQNYFRKYARASAGFGFGWNGAFGRIEFVYSAKVIQKKGDVASEFQVIFGN